MDKWNGIHQKEKRALLLLWAFAQKEQSSDAETEDHEGDFCLPLYVGVSPQREVGTAEQLFSHLEGLVVLQLDRKMLGGERLAAPV